MDSKESDMNEFFEERAAILEFDGGLSRKAAEASAIEETKIHMFRCLIRKLIQLNRSGRRADVVAWLDGSLISGGRDKAERKRYADALNQQIKLGNQGRAGEWK